VGKHIIGFVFLGFVLCMQIELIAQNGLIDVFPLEKSDLRLERLAQPATPFDKVGRKFAVLGYESGSFEAWAYPLKLFRNFEFSFLLKSSIRPVRGADIVRSVQVTPAATTLTFTYQSFTVKAHYITPIRVPGSLILLDVAATEPLDIVCSFIPVLQPMWPAGMGGQYAFWNDDINAYIFSESTRKHHGVLGSPAAEGVSYTPAHMLSDVPNEFRISIDNPDSVAGKFIPIAMAGGKGERQEIVSVYQDLLANARSYYQKAVDHYRTLRERTLRIKTPDPQINLSLEWAKVAYDNLIVDNPDLGTGLVAGLGASGTGGRPGFGWFFGGDTYINALSLNSIGNYGAVKQALEFMTQFQREDGKMAHEISQAAGYIDWFGNYPYGYIHGDTSPYFVVVVEDYVKLSGDVDFVRRHWTTIRKAYEWSLSTDGNGDGLMDNAEAGLGALEYGQLTDEIATDIYIGAVWTRATQAMHRLATIAGEISYAERVKKHAEQAMTSFKGKFWDEDSRFYSYAFDKNGRHVKEFSPWSAVGMMWELGDPERSRHTLERLGSSELTTDWGVRSISDRSPFYQPLNYNYGAVWPFLNGWVATAQFKHHFMLQGYTTLMATIRHVFQHQLGTVGEVFSGDLYTWPQESVSHQGFSTAGTVLPLVRGLLGLEGDAMEKKIVFAPHFPANWQEVVIDSYRIGNAVLSFYTRRNTKEYIIDIHAEHSDGYTVRLAPAFSVGTDIRSIHINGDEIDFDVAESPQVIQPTFCVPAENGLTQIHIQIEPTVEILPPRVDSRVGDRNKGLKIISITREGATLILECEGLAGETYALPMLHPELIQRMEGGTLEGDAVLISFPDSSRPEFLRKQIRIVCR